MSAIWYVSTACFVFPICMCTDARLLYASQNRGFSLIAWCRRRRRTHNVVTAAPNATHTTLTHLQIELNRAVQVTQLLQRVAKVSVRLCSQQHGNDDATLAVTRRGRSTVAAAVTPSPAKLGSMRIACWL
jgi:hypothetical protein